MPPKGKRYGKLKRPTPPSWKTPPKPVISTQKAPKKGTKRAAFDRWLEPVALTLGGSLMSATNADGSIDAELRVPIPPRVSVVHVLQDIEAVLHKRKPQFKFWFRGGLFRPLSKKGQVLYGRARSQGLRYMTFWTKSPGWVLTFVTLRDIERQTTKKYKRRKAIEVIIRVHWSRSNKQPDQRR